MNNTQTLTLTVVRNNGIGYQAKDKDIEKLIMTAQSDENAWKAEIKEEDGLVVWNLG